MAITKKSTKSTQKGSSNASAKSSAKASPKPSKSADKKNSAQVISHPIPAQKDDSHPNSLQENVENIVKQKRHRNRPDLKNFGAENAKPGDNSRFLRFAMASLNLPPIDISDANQVEKRIQEYFAFCIENDRKPNIVGMANWLGVDRDTVASWRRGEYRVASHSTLIKKYITLLEELWVDYMQNGKVNPASGIFLGKNCFGYKDVQDVVVTPNNPLGNELSAEDIAVKYKELPGE